MLQLALSDGNLVLDHDVKLHLIKHHFNHLILQFLEHGITFARAMHIIDDFSQKSGRLLVNTLSRLLHLWIHFLIPKILKQLVRLLLIPLLDPSVLLQLSYLLLQQNNLLPKQFELPYPFPLETGRQIIVSNQLLHLLIPILVQVRILILPPLPHFIDNPLLHQIVNEFARSLDLELPFAQVLLRRRGGFRFGERDTGGYLG